MLAQQLVNGVVAGATYSLFALGFTLMFGVLGVVNLTYGFYFSVGAFLALLATLKGAPIWLALPLAGIGSGFVAVALDTLLLTRLRRAKAPELASLMLTIGATLMLYSGMSGWLGTEIRRFPAGVIGQAGFEIGGVRFNTSQILIVATTAVIVVALLMLIQKTRLGLAVRALAENAEAAQLMGVNADFVVFLISFIAGALGGVAGVLVGLNFNAIQPYMGEAMMLKGFAVMVIGGLGNVRGALVAGMLVGMIEVLVAGFISSTLKEAVGFLLLVLTLWFRPYGLFGRGAAKRA